MPRGDPAVRDRARARARADRGREGLARARPRAGARAPSSRARFFRAYVRQVTIEGVYHADPHRGNVLLTPTGRLALLDFGLLGRLDDDTRRVARAAPARDRAEPRRRRRRPDPRALARRRLASDQAGVRPRAPPQAAALPLAAARRHPRRRGARRPAADRAPRTGSGCRRASRSSARRSRRRTRSRATLDPELDPIALMEDDALEVMLDEVGAPARAATRCSR